MLNRTEARPLFAIQLKVNEDVLDIEVLETDDRESLTDRVCRDNRISSEYKKLLENKIIQALQKIIQRQQINPSLREKVERFVYRNSELPQRRIHTITTEPNNQTSGSLSVASPIKVKSPPKRATPVRSKQNMIESSSSHMGSSQKRQSSPQPNRPRQPIWNLYCHRIPNIIVEEQKKPQIRANIMQSNAQNIPVERKGSVTTKQDQKPKSAGIKKQNTGIAYKATVVTKQINHTNNSASTVAKQSQQNLSEKKPYHKKTLTEADEDLIKAYKVVVAKCKDPEMKSMAKRYLETLNRSFAEVSPNQSRKKSSGVKQAPASSNKKKSEEKMKSSEKKEPEPAQYPTSANLQSNDRLKRLKALQQPAVPGQFYQEKLNGYVQDKYERLPPSRLSPARPKPSSAVPQSIGLSTGDPVIDQPYERRYGKEAATRSPYEYLTSKYPSVGNTIHRSSTGNINKSSECSPFVSHSNRYHYQTSLESVQETNMPRCTSQPYNMDNKYRSMSNNQARRYRYLQEE